MLCFSFLSTKIFLLAKTVYAHETNVTKKSIFADIMMIVGKKIFLLTFFRRQKVYFCLRDDDCGQKDLYALVAIIVFSANNFTWCGQFCRHNVKNVDKGKNDEILTTKHTQAKETSTEALSKRKSDYLVV